MSSPPPLPISQSQGTRTLSSVSVSGFTRLCKGLALILVAAHLVLHFFPSAITYLALIPARTIPFAWNLITAGYVEQTVHGVVISIVCLLFIGKLLEPVWGPREFLKFIFIVNFLTSVCIFITAIALYYITRQEIYLYTPLSGFHGVISGFLVSIKQIIPDQEIPFLKIKMKVLLCQSAFQEILKQMMNRQSSDDACVTSGELLEEIVAKESASLMKDSRRKREDIGKGLVHDQYQLRDAKTGKVMQRLRT